MKKLLFIFLLFPFAASADECKENMTRADFLHFTSQQKTRMDESCVLFFKDTKPHTTCWTDTKENGVKQRNVECE